MVTGVVLGWANPVAELLRIEGLDTQDLLVVTDNEDAIELLSPRALSVRQADPSDRATLGDLPRPPVIFVAHDDPRRVLEIAQRATVVFPTVRIVAFCPAAATPNERERLRGLADHLVDALETTSDRFIDAASSPAAVRALRVKDVLQGLEGSLAVLTHDNPDPDAIASATALVRLAERLDVPATAYYFGEITHQSNRALINTLDLGLEPLNPEMGVPDVAGIALVDHAIPGINDSLPPETDISLVFDHHRPSGPVDASYVDIREGLGSTSTMLVEYLRQFVIEIDEALATALLYGMQTDTRNFSRHVTPLDLEAAGHVWPHVDHDQLRRIATPAVSETTMEILARAISNRTVEGPVLASCVGTCREKDALAQAAELMVQLESVHIVLIYGLDGDTVYASGRARAAPAGIDLSLVMRDAFSPIGSAGGHVDMAGAQIPLGVLAEGAGEDEERIETVRDVIEGRFFEAARDAIEIRFGVGSFR